MRSRSSAGPNDEHRGPTARQFLAGLVALPLSVLPFVAYLTMTPEGRLVRDRVQATFFPTDLPTLDAKDLWYAAATAPAYDAGVMTLAYHGVGSTADDDGGMAISPTRFAEHLATLKAAGMNSVTAADVVSAAREGRPLPQKAVMITFDDGRADAMMHADPLLEAAGMRATMFVITGAADEPGIYYASWDRLQAAARSGRWDLQAHTDALHREQRVADGQRLPALTSLAPGESLDEYRARVRADLARCSEELERRTGRAPIAFAYPFGAYGAERTNHPAVRGILREEVARRYAVAFHQDEQESVPLVAAGQDPLGLRRLEVGDWSGLELLKRIAGAAAATPGATRPASVPPPAAPAPAPPGPPNPPASAPTAPVATLVPLVAPVMTIPPLAALPVPSVTTPAPTVPTTTSLPPPPAPAVPGPTTTATTALPPPPPSAPTLTTTPPTTGCDRPRGAACKKT